MTAPFAVPSDSTTPYPASFERLVQHLGEMRFSVDILTPGRAAGAVFDTIPFLFSFDSSGRFLSIRAIWDTDLSPEKTAYPLFAAADGWNREKYFPTIYWITTPEGGVQACADFIIDTAAGISDDQLTHNIAAGISTGIDAMKYMHEAVAQALPAASPAE